MIIISQLARPLITFENLPGKLYLSGNCCKLMDRIAQFIVKMKRQLWKKTSTYLILIAVCVGIILIEIVAITLLDRMNKGELINDNIAEGILFFLCIPGILTGLIGAVICAVRKK